MKDAKKVMNPALLDQLLKDVPMGDMDFFNKMFQQLKKSLIERALEGELTHHLGYPKHAKALQRINAMVNMIRRLRQKKHL